MTTPADRDLLAHITRDERTIACPLHVCDWTLDVPPVEVVPALADVLGISARGLAEVHAGQAADRAIREARTHLKSHTVDEWVAAVIPAFS